MTITGKHGNGPRNYVLEIRRTNGRIVGITEVKKQAYYQGIAQNVVQIESALGNSICASANGVSLRIPSLIKVQAAKSLFQSLTRAQFPMRALP
ncbi:hypothetical protein BDZ91DRAFT_715020 [Kalaharituber pfeilii]|nr:hypothetical protein BDZ91DRAFT_715020 [Kalaharituber pfeilii]